MALTTLALSFATVGFVGCGEGGNNDGSSTFAESLEYQKISGKEEYRVTGIGSISDVDVVVPSTYRGLPVTEIADNAFSGEISVKNTYIESVVIPDSVTTIGYCVFYNCDSLTSIEIPDSVTTIGNSAFV